MKTISNKDGTSNDPFLKIYDNVMTAEECAITLTLAEQFKLQFRNSNDHAVSNKKGRIDEQLFLLNAKHTLPFKNKFQHWIAPYWDKYAAEFNIRGTCSDVFCPHYKIQESKTGGGFTKPHFEQEEGRSASERFAVWMIYLNDDFEGGGTHFPIQNTTIMPKAGSLVIWPAAYTHPHHAVDNLKGTKWIATGWFRFKFHQAF